MKRSEAEMLLRHLIPLAERESTLLSPKPRHILDAESVFDLVRESCDPPITKVEFNALADEVEHG